MHKENTRKLTLTRKEAAKRLGISIVTLDREIRRGFMPHVRVGRRVLFTEDLLEKYIQQRTKNAE